MQLQRLEIRPRYWGSDGQVNLGVMFFGFDGAEMEEKRVFQTIPFGGSLTISFDKEPDASHKV